MSAMSAGRGLAAAWLLAVLLLAASDSVPDPVGPAGADADSSHLLDFDGGSGAPRRAASWGNAVASWARPGRLLAAVGLGGGDEEDRSPLQAAVGNVTVLAASAGCMSCCSSNPDCSHAYMNSDVGHCCVKEPATCCPSFARCAMNGCMRNNGPTRSYYSPAPHHSSTGGFLLLVIVLVALCCLCGACGGMAAGGPAMGGGMMGGPAMMGPGFSPGYGGGWGGGGWGGGGYSGGALAGAGGAGFLGGLGTGMLLEQAFDRPNYGYGGGFGGGEMYSMQGGGESWMPADGGGGGGEIMADGGGGDF